MPALRIVLVALAAALTTAGCPDVHFQCAGDAECPRDQICHLGECLSPDAVGCPSGAAPGVIVRVTTSSGELVCDAFVHIGGEVAAVNEGDVADAGVAPGFDAGPAGVGCFYEGGGTGSVDVDVEKLSFTAQHESVDVVEGRCGPVTEIVDVVLVEKGPSCTGDASCDPGDACVVAADEGSAACTANAAGRGNGGGCADDSACLHGLCKGGLCSGLCDPNGADCALSQECVPDEALFGADVCTLAALDDVGCSSDADCVATGRVCAQVDADALGLLCRLPSPGTAAKGEKCFGEGTSDDCASGLCDDGEDGRCTNACNDDGDCAGGVQNTCTSIAIDGVDARACFETCARESDCFVGDPASVRACRARADVTANAIVFACDGPRGQGALGDAASSGSDCRSNFSVTGAGGAGRICSAPCLTDEDCGDVFLGLTCQTVGLNRPDGTLQNVLACAPP